MKTINLSDYKGDGVFINLENSYINYENLIYYPDKYLDKNKTYYVKCKAGVKSRKVVLALESKGYKAIRVI